MVENDLEGWAKPITAFLQADLGHKAQIATNAEDAIEKAREFAPAILCLDMHLPENRKAFAHNPLSGQSEAGLDVLSRIRAEVDEDVLALALTDLYEQDDLRAAAVRRGIDINHWIAKDRNWKSNLGYAVWRLAKEFTYGTRTPAAEGGSDMPSIRLQRSVPRTIWIDGVEIKKLSSNLSKLIWALTERSNLPVSRTELIKAVYGEDTEQRLKDEGSALNSLIRRARRDIEKSLEKTGKEINGKELIMEAGNGYMLRALPSIQE